MTTKRVRHFTFKHPLFKNRLGTNTGVRYEDSIYYYWWRFLRLHEGYKRTCERGGEGPLKSLFADFGDVHNTDFKTWWSKDGRGADLFAEPAVPDTVEALSVGDLAELAVGWDQDAYLVIGIPLRMPKTDIQRRVARLVRKHHHRKRGERLIKESKAKYPVVGQFSTTALKSILEVYELRQEEPDMALWEIAQRVGFMKTKLTADEVKFRGTGEASDKKLSMSSATSRKLRQAKVLIEGVGKGRFPVFK
jgi:hypothetical protein